MAAQSGTLMNIPMMSLHLSSREAAAELLRRRQARAGLLAFAQYTNPAYEPAAHHKLIADALERVLRGECKRLIIAMPPRHGKSELASRRFPAFAVGLRPEVQIIAASYNSDLASDFGREVRNIVGSTEYAALFSTKLAQDSKAANRWHTDKGGMYVAAGVGTAITGRGADILLIDDPFKDRQEADSELQRQRVWDWYTSTAYTRLMPGGSVIVINTRWHDDDLSGRLLAEQEDGGDQWEVVSLPAIDDKGAPLWPEWYPLDRLEQIRSVLPARDWNSLYQQNPIPDDGDYFRSAWFTDYEQLPELLNFYGASDYAVTDHGGDFTEHGVFGVDQNGNIYVVDWWFGQTDSMEWIERKCDLIIKHEPAMWFGESGPIRRAVEPFMMRRMQERKAWCPIEWLPSINDKASRARSIQGRASMGKVFLPKNAAWKGHVLAQLLRFPAGKHDDAVDVFSLIGRGLEYIRPAKPKPKKKTERRVASGWMG
jgi:predicted phage terminase large subunit-like protein